MKNLTTTLAALVIMSASSVFADGHKVKVGMITTLSGGGSGLGIDVRDGFMLAVKGNKNISVITKDDQRKPDIAVQLADKMIQSDKVDVLTGIIWSNLAMAVVPATVNQGKFYLSPNAGPSKLAGKSSFSMPTVSSHPLPGSGCTSFIKSCVIFANFGIPS